MRACVCEGQREEGGDPAGKTEKDETEEDFQCQGKSLHFILREVTAQEGCPEGL